VLREEGASRSAAPQAGAFTGKAEAKQQNSLQAAGPGGPDWVRGWYENRKALEGMKLRKEDFEMLSAAVAKEFAARREGRKDPEAAKSTAGAAQRLAARFEFACPDCAKASPGLSPCPDCGRIPVLRPRE
jgi:predicted RNA-binding Zn-ribbon protein involved in translation (DUF1610 family)